MHAVKTWKHRRVIATKFSKISVIIYNILWRKYYILVALNRWDSAGVARGVISLKTSFILMCWSRMKMHQYSSCLWVCICDTTTSVILLHFNGLYIIVKWDKIRVLGQLCQETHTCWLCWAASKWADFMSQSASGQCHILICVYDKWWNNTMEAHGHVLFFSCDRKRLEWVFDELVIEIEML